ncbi:MAG: T9SS type A sorting domain-containing protein [Ignavibacteriaceae bacterium]|nr:T9SS type A sorting domain-containing protein [Ignavibacteriaceae bacterium]
MKKILLFTVSFCFSFISWAQTINSFNHTFNGPVRCLAIWGNTMYVGGGANTVDSISHYGIAAFDLTTHALLSFNAWFNDYVDCIAVSSTGDTIFVGGEFHFTGNGNFSTPRNGLAAYHKNGTLLDWNPDPGSYIFSLVIKDTILYVGGNFGNISGTSRNRLAAFSLTDMSLTAWNPDVNSGTAIKSIAVSVTGDTVYAGGTFDKVNGGTTRNYLASFNSSDGSVTAWDPNLNNIASALALSGNTLIVGGSFTNVAGGTSSRNYLASYNTSTGALNTWNPDLNQVVHSLVIKGSRVYVAGNFTTVAGGVTTRNHLAAFDTASSITTNWNPNANDLASAIATTSTEIYVGGSFTNVLGFGRQSVAGMDDQLTSATLESTIPAAITLEQNYPNPFNPSTKISWQSPISSHQTLKVYDLLGNEVTTLVDEYLPAGTYETEFSAKGLTSGIYFYRFKQVHLLKQKRC